MLTCSVPSAAMLAEDDEMHDYVIRTPALERAQTISFAKGINVAMATH